MTVRTATAYYVFMRSAQVGTGELCLVCREKANGVLAPGHCAQMDRKNGLKLELSLSHGPNKPPFV